MISPSSTVPYSSATILAMGEVVGRLLGDLAPRGRPLKRLHRSKNRSFMDGVAESIPAYLPATPSAQSVQLLLDLPQDALLSISESLLNDDAGTLALALLCGSCTALRCFGKEVISPFIGKLAFDFCHVAHVKTTEEYAVIAALSRAGGTQLTFTDAGVDLKPAERSRHTMI